MSNSDEELLRRCRAGDELAWEEIIDNYKRLVYSIPLNFGLPAEDAADVSQQTFISLVDNLEKRRSDSNVGVSLIHVSVMVNDSLLADAITEIRSAEIGLDMSRHR